MKPGARRVMLGEGLSAGVTERVVRTERAVNQAKYEQKCEEKYNLHNFLLLICVYVCVFFSPPISYGLKGTESGGSLFT